MTASKSHDDAHIQVIEDATRRELYLYSNPGDIISGRKLIRKVWTADSQGKWKVEFQMEATEDKY